MEIVPHLRDDFLWPDSFIVADYGFGLGFAGLVGLGLLPLPLAG
jgi:hypothetical protein